MLKLTSAPDSITNDGLTYVFPFSAITGSTTYTATFTLQATKNGVTYTMVSGSAITISVAGQALADATPGDVTAPLTSDSDGITVAKHMMIIL